MTDTIKSIQEALREMQLNESVKKLNQAAIHAIYEGQAYEWFASLPEETLEYIDENIIDFLYEKSPQSAMNVNKMARPVFNNSTQAAGQMTKLMPQGYVPSTQAPSALSRVGAAATRAAPVAGALGAGAALGGGAAIATRELARTGIGRDIGKAIGDYIPGAKAAADYLKPAGAAIRGALGMDSFDGKPASQPPGTDGQGAAGKYGYNTTIRTGTDAAAAAKQLKADKKLPNIGVGTGSKPESTAKPPTDFKSAFAAARKEAGGGKGQFEFGGKKYQTNIAGEKYVPMSQQKKVNIGTKTPAGPSMSDYQRPQKGPEGPPMPKTDTSTAKPFLKPGVDANKPSNVPSSTTASLPSSERPSTSLPAGKDAPLPPTRPASISTPPATDPGAAENKKRAAGTLNQSVEYDSLPNLQERTKMKTVKEALAEVQRNVEEAKMARIREEWEAVNEVEKPVGSVKTKASGAESSYPVYKKGGEASHSFQSTYKSAKPGSTFKWKDSSGTERSYKAGAGSKGSHQAPAGKPMGTGPKPQNNLVGPKPAENKTWADPGKLDYSKSNMKPTEKPASGYMQRDSARDPAANVRRDASGGEIGKYSDGGRTHSLEAPSSTPKPDASLVTNRPRLGQQNDIGASASDNVRKQLGQNPMTSTKAKIGEETEMNPLIAAFLRLQETKAGNVFEAAKKAKKPNDGNLANNYPPYDKVTRGDVIAGRLGKDQMGGKLKEGTAEAETSMNVTKDKKPSTPAQTNASTSGPSASDKAALTSKIKSVKEEGGFIRGLFTGGNADQKKSAEPAKKEEPSFIQKSVDSISPFKKAADAMTVKKEEVEQVDEVKIFHRYLGRPEKDGSLQSKMERSHIARGAKERRALTPGSGVSGFNKAMDRKLDPKTYKNKSREAGEVRARNEEVEQIDELDRKTLQSYVRKVEKRGETEKRSEGLRRAQTGIAKQNSTKTLDAKVKKLGSTPADQMKHDFEYDASRDELKNRGVHHFAGRRTRSEEVEFSEEEIAFFNSVMEANPIAPGAEKETVTKETNTTVPQRDLTDETKKK